MTDTFVKVDSISEGDLNDGPRKRIKNYKEFKAGVTNIYISTYIPMPSFSSPIPKRYKVIEYRVFAGKVYYFVYL